MTLISLVYSSVSRHQMSDDELLQILDEARENNQKIDVTGILLYRNRFFLQALEGDKETVEALFAKIAKDERHLAVTVIAKQNIEERSFPNWSMGFNTLTEDKLKAVEGYSGDLTTEFFTEKPSRATMLVKSFQNR